MAMTPWRSSPAQISRPAVELEVQRQPNRGPARRGPFSFEGDFVEGLYSQQQQADLAGLLAIISSSGAKTGSAHAQPLLDLASISKPTVQSGRSGERVPQQA